MFPALRIEYSNGVPRKTKMTIAAPLIDNVSVGIMTVLEEVGVRLRAVSVGGIRPIDYIVHDDEPVKWKQTPSTFLDVFEWSVDSVLDMLELLHLADEEVSKLRELLDSQPHKVYEFQFDTDFRIVGIGRDKLNHRILAVIVELCARRQPLSNTIDDHCGL